MKTVSSDYINSKFVNAILIRECTSSVNEFKVSIDSKYYVLHKEELFEIKFEEINHSKFIQVPAIRLIETIKDEAEVIVNNNKEICYFEAEQDVKYLINLDNVVRVQKLDTQVWKITMVDDIYYFKAFPANMSIFTNRLHA